MSEDEVQLEIPAEKPEEQGEPLPEGKYTIVACDIDTTGRRLIDEVSGNLETLFHLEISLPHCQPNLVILPSWLLFNWFHPFFFAQLVQIAIYAPGYEYSQYIMPLMNLNPAARQRHQVRVITVGFFRMLKSMQTYKVVRTKTEVATLNEFLAQMEKIKQEDAGSDGIILVFHEARKFIPYMLIEAMKKYNLLDRFLSTVKSMVNTYSIAVDKLGKTMKFFSVRQIAKVLLNIDDDLNDNHLFEGSAAVRAKMAYEIVEHIACKGDQDDDDEEQDAEGEKAEANTDDDAEAPKMAPEELSHKLGELIYSYAHSIDAEIDELKEQERMLERQGTFRPVFLRYFRTTLRLRVKAVNFRRVLAEHGYDLDKLKEIWDNSKCEGLTAAVNAIKDLKEADCTELVELLDQHFDPEKVDPKPKISRQSTRRTRPRMSNGGNGQPNTQGNEHGQPKDGGAKPKHAPEQRHFHNNNNKENIKANNNKGEPTADVGPKKGQDMQKRPAKRSFRRSRNINRNNRAMAAAN